MPAAPPPISEITDQVTAEAKANPNGWVYAICGGYSNTEAVPPKRSVGFGRLTRMVTFRAN